MRKIAFIGAGELAESLVNGFINARICAPESICLTNRSNSGRLADLKQKYGVQTTSDKSHAIERADVVILAFRPADTREALSSIKKYLNAEQLILSLMVGVPSAFIQKITGQRLLQVVRAMPNTSASISVSATGLAAGANVSAQNLALARRLFESVGTVTVVSEKEIDRVAGLSGSGPAYLYYLAQAMVDAGIHEGLTAEASEQLVRQTISGAAQLLNRSGKNAGQLLRAVATPGGTTQAGINALEKYQVHEAVAACVHQAILRAEELSLPFSNE